MKKRFLSLAATLLFALSVQAAPRTVTIGLSSKSPEETQKNFAELQKYLGASADPKYNVVIYPSYDALYDAFKENKVDFALVGAVKYVEAHHELGAIPVIIEGGMVRSVIVVPKASPIKTAAELKGKKFAFGYKDSTSTHLMPLLLLSKNHLKENDVVGEFVGGDQQKIVEKLVSGADAAGAVVESVYRMHQNELRVLESSPQFPGGPLVAHKNVDPKLLEDVRKTFLGFKNPGGIRFSEGATAVKDTDFNQIRFLVKVLYGKSLV